MAETTLNLGSFEFAELEIPAEIRIGGAQRLSMHELVGGARVIDAMGRTDRPLEWSGILLGETAISRAQALDAMRIAGLPQPLVWSAYSYQVIVREFEAAYQRKAQLAYRIVCEVLSDLTTPVGAGTGAPFGAGPSDTIDEQMDEDMAEADELTSEIADPPLSTAMSKLDSAIASVSSFAKAAQSTINSVLQPLAAVQARVGMLIASTANTIANVTTLGGVLPNNPLSMAAARLTGQVAAMSQAGVLYNLRNVLGRMGNNLGAVTAAPTVIATSGGNLFDIARKSYGSATEWTGIARANNVVDPFIVGPRTLTVPTRPDNADGLLRS